MCDRRLIIIYYYIVVCTGDFNKDSGIIEAPKVNVKTYYCVWQRRPQTDEETYTNRSLSLIINAPVIGRRNMHNCKYARTSISIGTGEYILPHFCFPVFFFSIPRCL